MRKPRSAYTKGDLQEAIRIAKVAVAAASDSKQSAHSLDRLGFFQYTAGDLKTGEASLRQALEIRKTKIGEDTLDYAESANDLALLCRDTNQFAEGRKLAEQAVSIRSKLLGARDPLVAESLNTLGGILVFQGEYDGAIASMEGRSRFTNRNRRRNSAKNSARCASISRVRISASEGMRTPKRCSKKDWMFCA